jgi:hypothetical protein
MITNREPFALDLNLLLILDTVLAEPAWFARPNGCT